MPRHPPSALSSLTIKFTHEQRPLSNIFKSLAQLLPRFSSTIMYGITNKYMIEDYSHYSIVKDLLRLILGASAKTPKIQHSTNKQLLLSAQLRAG